MQRTMEQTLDEFRHQFSYEPGVANADTLGGHERYLVLGMGGSHLAADLIRRARPTLDLAIWSDYGLPEHIDMHERLVVASSYSGNTEEVLDGLRVAGERGIPTAVISTGGTLIARARELRLPYVELPATGIQPRNALGYTLRGLCRLMHLEDDLVATAALEKQLADPSLREQGEELGRAYRGRIPVFYASRANETVAYNWKIKCNETAKIPAFFSVFPELDHNELAGMDVTEHTKELSQKLAFFFLTDTADHERVALRMRVTKELYSDRHIMTHELPLSGSNVYERAFRSLMLADWFALTLAGEYDSNSDAVPIIEEFKKMIS